MRRDPVSFGISRQQKDGGFAPMCTSTEGLIPSNHPSFSPSPLPTAVPASLSAIHRHLQHPETEGMGGTRCHRGRSACLPERPAVRAHMTRTCPDVTAPVGSRRRAGYCWVLAAWSSPICRKEVDPPDRKVVFSEDIRDLITPDPCHI